MFNYNKLIRKMNSYFIKTWEKPFPLASGNCGIFAISLSSFLKEKGIPHHIEVWSTSVSEKKEFTPMELIKYDILPDHVVVIMENGYSIDFCGVRKPDYINKLAKTWEIEKLNRYKVIKYFECGMESYVEEKTRQWLTSEVFNEYIKNNW